MKDDRPQRPWSGRKPPAGIFQDRRWSGSLTAFCVACAAGGALAQGFAGLGTDAEGFALPAPNPEFDYPADHGPHPDFRIEWWYVTANLEDANGRPYGVQWTLFRSALSPGASRAGWAAAQAWMGHAALTTPERHFVAERLARGGIGQAGVKVAPYKAWIDEWRVAGPRLRDVTMEAAGPDFAFALSLETDRPFVPQGEAGYSVKSQAGQASYYYSQPFYDVAGTLTLPEGEVAVTGQAWLDREWSSQPLARTQTGWDWFSLHLDGGAKLMAFRLRDEAGADYTSATWIAPDGGPQPFPDGAVTATPLAEAEVAGRAIPVRWRLELPARDLDVTVAAINEDAWNDTAFPYWEGPVTVEGGHEGIGYLEMTGYE